MARQSRGQLVLDLDHPVSIRPVAHPPEGLVQALADLLLEALGEETAATASRMGAGDDAEDHA